MFIYLLAALAFFGVDFSGRTFMTLYFEHVVMVD